jgi:hypothetical protein
VASRSCGYGPIPLSPAWVRVKCEVLHLDRGYQTDWAAEIDSNIAGASWRGEESWGGEIGGEIFLRSLSSLVDRKLEVACSPYSKRHCRTNLQTPYLLTYIVAVCKCER